MAKKTTSSNKKIIKKTPPRFNTINAPASKTWKYVLLSLLASGIIALIVVLVILL